MILAITGPMGVAIGTPVSVAELALCQTRAALSEVTWQNGSGPQRRGHFAALRLQPASGHCQGLAPEPEQWLIWEWPEGAERPEHYWLSTLPNDTPLERLVYLAKLRWRVERDYQEMKSEVGLDHYEGRTWNGLHHHLALLGLHLPVVSISYSAPSSLMQRTRGEAVRADRYSQARWSQPE